MSCRDIYNLVKEDITSLKEFMSQDISAEAKKATEECCYILQRNLQELKTDWLPVEEEFRVDGLSDTQQAMLLKRHAVRALNFKEWRMV